MIKRYRYGAPVNTEAAVIQIAESKGQTVFSERECEGKTAFGYEMEKEDRVYGLGEQMRGINKRGWIYESWNTDDPILTETRVSLYTSHNFIMVIGKNRSFGAFFDCGGKVVFDVGYTDPDVLTVTARDCDLYLIEGESALEIVHEFRGLIGTSYIPPKWAFGFGQSHWGYLNEGDIRTVAENYKACDMPLDMIYLDIDYMERFQDFTVDKKAFPDLKKLAADMKKENIRLIPIIDAAVKAEKGYSVYDEGVEKGYFCKNKKGEPYIVGVWPQDSVLPDVLNPAARKWFGSQYKVLMDEGIEGFWNDMNEPGIFYGEESMAAAVKTIEALVASGRTKKDFAEVQGAVFNLPNSMLDYGAFYHEKDGKRYCHAEVHNLFGYYMTRAAAEYFEERDPDKRFLMFSRSSYIGMHRYGGIWTGDNAAWWAHLLLNLKMLPSLDMCGFLFTGADLCGFGQNTTEDLALRWLALGIFTPLMRNHYNASRPQEYYVFKNKEAFRNLLGIRYSLLPYLYSEFVKSALRGQMLFKPLAFEYPQDGRAQTVEDQLFVGESIMIAPVYEQNAKGRYVYLPEEMKLIRMRAGDRYTQEVLPQGSHYIEVALDEVIFFLRKNRVMPLAHPAKNVASLDEKNLTWLKFTDRPITYEICRDDGFVKKNLERYIERVTVNSN